MRYLLMLSTVAGLLGALRIAAAQAPAAVAPVTIQSVSISLDQQARIHFGAEPRTTSNTTTMIHVAGDMTRPCAGRIAMVRNVIGQDDRGNLVTAPGGSNITESGLLWNARFSLSGLHPQARKLEWIEGEVLVFNRVEATVVEIPLPLDEKGTRREIGPVDFELSKIVSGDTRVGPRLIGRVSAPEFSRLHGADGRSRVAPLLEGASGLFYAPVGSRLGGERYRPGAVILDLDLEYPVIDEPVVKVRTNLMVKAEPVRQLAFRLTDIGIPQAAPFVPARTGKGVDALPPTHPFYAAGGGTLVAQVRVDGRPAPAGTCAVGLSMEQAGAVSPVRWVDVSVDSAGATRLGNLRPGRYRVIRIYRPAEALGGAGRWRHAETQALVTRGKETRLPELQWVPDTPTQPGR